MMIGTLIVVGLFALVCVAAALFGNGFGQRDWDTRSFPTGQAAFYVSADGYPEYKEGGVTIDWGAVAAAGADVTLPDGTKIKTGEKYLRYGTPIIRNQVKEVQTVTITGTPTGGSFTLTLTLKGQTKTTAAIAHNATAAAVQTALNDLDNVESGDVVVTGGPGPGTPYTVTFQLPEDVAQMTAAHTFTGGAAPAVAVATTTGGTTSLGMFRPAVAADNAAYPGGRGDLYVNNYTVKEDEYASNHAGGWFDGGSVFVGRLNVGGAGQLTEAQLLGMMPRLKPVRD
jgi:hypothetical protein